MELTDALRRYKSGEMAEAELLEFLSTYPVLDLGIARLDRHRGLRKGFPEVVFGQAKSPDQLTEILRGAEAAGMSLLVTRLPPEVFGVLSPRFPGLRYHARSRCAYQGELPEEEQAPAPPFILAAGAGTSDAPVVEEAALTARLMGCRVETVHDVGVAGLHRILAHLPRLRLASVVVVAAGMDAALPGVVAGLVRAPVVAVPTSVGYGSSLQGLAALLAMLNSCAPGVTVVNIDNGFGAGYAAAQMLAPAPSGEAGSGADAAAEASAAP